MWVVGFAIRGILPFDTWLDTLGTLNSILFFLMFWFHLVAFVAVTRLPRERWAWFEKTAMVKTTNINKVMVRTCQKKREAAAIDILKF